MNKFVGVAYFSFATTNMEKEAVLYTQKMQNNNHRQNVLLNAVSQAVYCAIIIIKVGIIENETFALIISIFFFFLLNSHNKCNVNYCVKIILNVCVCIRVFYYSCNNRVKVIVSSNTQVSRLFNDDDELITVLHA